MTYPRGSRPDRAGKTGDEKTPDETTPSETPSVGKASVGKASVKEAIGKLIGDVKVQAEGKAEKRSSKSDGKPGSARTP